MCMHKYNEDGRTAPDVPGHGFVPLSLSRNVVTRIGLHKPYPADSSIARNLSFRTWLSINGVNSKVSDRNFNSILNLILTFSSDSYDNFNVLISRISFFSSAQPAKWVSIIKVGCII